jgi:hypothetical protein
MIKIRFIKRRKKENNKLLFLFIITPLWLAIIIIKEIQNVNEIKIEDIESWAKKELYISHEKIGEYK